MIQAIRRYWLRHRSVVLPLTIFAVVANFLHFRSFGLYEDDWYYTVTAWSTPAATWFAELLYSVRHFYLGRPLQEACLYFFAYLGACFASIGSLYVIAALLYCATVVLAYHVLRLRYPIFFASVAALLFAISPITTIRQYLDGTLWSAPGLILLFLAILVYARRRGWQWSYVLATMALLIYEPFFFVFLAAPVFRRRRNNTWLRIAIHLAICAAILLVYLFIRRQVSEQRLVSSLAERPIDIVWHMAEFALFCTLRSFTSYTYGMSLALREISAEAAFWTLGLVLLAVATLFRSRISGIIRGKRPGRSFARGMWWIRRAALPGLLTILLGYAVSYYSMTQTLSYPLAGRDTRFSLAATFGSSIFVASVLLFLLTILRGRIWKLAIVVASLGVLSLLTIYSFVIQDDYAREWAHDRALLAQVVALSPDVTPDTLIVLHRSWVWEPPFLKTRRLPAMNSQPHGVEISLRHLFEHRHGPMIFLVYSDAWKTHLGLQPDGRVHWTKPSFDSSSPRDLTVPVGPIITLVEEPSGCVRRTEDPVYVGDRQIVLVRDRQPEGKPVESNWAKFAVSPLAPAVFDNAGGCLAPSP